MKTTVLVLYLAAAALALPRKTIKVPFKDTLLKNRIVVGEDAQYGQFPWQALLKFDSMPGVALCGASLINSRIVLTAAHCLDFDFIVEVSIKLGGLSSDIDSLESGSVIVTTDKFVLHENYDRHTIENDIAVIDLQKDVEITDTIKPIPIGEVKDDQIVTVIGWGKTSSNSSLGSPTLKFVALKTVNLSVCDEVYGEIFPTMVCCRGEGIKGICNGDSGGPLVSNTSGVTVQVGIVSFGHNDGCESGQPLGFTRAASYIDWIDQQFN